MASIANAFILTKCCSLAFFSEDSDLSAWRYYRLRNGARQGEACLAPTMYTVLALRMLLVHLPDRTYFDAAMFRGRQTRCDANRFVKIFGFDQVVTTELFTRFRKGSVGGDRLAAAHSYRGCGCNWF